ncbi:MAG: HYR domain-containing protein, partial [Saprospiraceae bacterium]
TSDEQLALPTLNKSYFIENAGQWPSEVFYKMSIGGLDAWITKDGVVYDFYLNEKVVGQDNNNISAVPALKPEKTWQRKGQVIAVELSESNLPSLEPTGTQEAYYNYIRGNDPSQWTSQVALYQEVKLANVFNQIDLKYYFDQGYLRYDYIVKPGGNPADIKFEINGCENYYVNAKGELILDTRFGAVKQKQLELYQIVNQQKVSVEGEFAQTDAGIHFVVGNYDATKDLIIDPLVWSTFIGGNSDEVVNDMLLDDNNNIYLTGYTQSSDFPTSMGAYDVSFNDGGEDVLLTKLDPTGSTLLYTTFIGGTQNEFGQGLALDNSNAVYLIGSTESADFPTTSGVYSQTLNGGRDVFVLKVNTDGTALAFSTLLGGNSFEFGHGIQLDNTGQIYLTGYTNSSNFPTTAGAYDETSNGNLDIFVSKMNATGTSLSYGTLIGGSGNDLGLSIAIDNGNNAYITGYTTDGTGFPTTTGAFAENDNGSSESFVIKLNAAGSALQYSTFIGGTGDDVSTGLKIDGAGNAYLYGYTQSIDFPTTTDAYSRIKVGGDLEGFVSKLNSLGSALVFSTYLGGNANDLVADLVLDDDQVIYLTGYTESSSFPTTTNADDASYNGNEDVFVAKLSANGTDLLYGSFMGGAGDEKAFNLGLDAAGALYVAGQTRSFDFPITPDSYDQNQNGGLDIFVTKMTITTSTSTTCLSDGITFSTQLEIDDFPINYPGCTNIPGNVTIDEASNGTITNLDGLAQLESIGGDLFFDGNSSIGNINGLSNLESIGGDLRFSYEEGLTNLLGLSSLTSLGGNLTVNNSENMLSLNGLQLLSSIGGTLNIYNNEKLASLTGLNNITSLGGSLGLWENSVLMSLDELASLVSISGGIYISRNAMLTSLNGLQNIDPNTIQSSASTLDDIEIHENPMLFDCAVTSICDALMLSGTTTDIRENATNCDSKLAVENICSPVATILTLNCPTDIAVTIPAGQNSTVVTWNAPTSTTTCLLGENVNLTQTSGANSGTNFTAGTYTISYEAVDDCENTENCSFTLTVNNTTVTTGCDDFSGFTKLGEYNGHSYYISDDKERWDNARVIGQNLGAYLATMNDQAENDFLKSKLGDELVYIGFSDAAQEGTGAWANGESVTIDLSFNNTDENDYAVMNFWAGTWDMSNKWVSKRFVLERNCLGNAPTSISLNCPADIELSTSTGTAIATWNTVTASTTCAGNNIVVNQTEGLPTGSTFAVGTYTISYEVTDDCGNTETCSFSITVVDNSTSACPTVLAGFTKLGEYEGHTYFMSDEKTQWTDAKVIAEDLGTYLVSINSQAENDFLKELLDSEMVFIGYTDEGSEGVGTWSNGDPVTFDLSFNNNSENDYAVMNDWAGTWGMNNKWVAKRFVVEQDCSTNGGSSLAINCPTEIYQTTTTGSAIVNWTMPTATTTCSNGSAVVFTQTEGLPAGSSFEIGTYNISYEVTDACNNLENCSFTITIEAEGTGTCLNELDGFTKLGEYQGNGYYLSDDKSRWPDAQTISEGFGGHLVVLENQAENDFLKSKLASELVYIGYSDVTNEGIGEWVNGVPVTLDLSYNNSDENDYAVMNDWAGTWEMNNYWVKKRFVMEVGCVINRTQPIATPTETDLFILKVNPNPAKDFINLKMETESSQSVVIEVFTINGKLVFQTKKDLSIGNTEMRIPIEELAKGFFLLQVSGPNFKETRKLVKE